LPGSEVYPISNSKAMHQIMQFTCPVVVPAHNSGSATHHCGV
jgi:hypothetical protein